MQIRNAELKDVIQIVNLAHEMHQETQFNQYDFDAVKLAEYVHTLIESDWGIALVAEHENEIVGGFIGAVWPHFFGNSRQAVDFGMFMMKEKRGGLTGYRLLKAYIKAAKEKNADEIVIANSTGVDREAVARLFEKVGFNHVGYVFTMNAKDSKE